MYKTPSTTTILLTILISLTIPPSIQAAFPKFKQPDPPPVPNIPKINVPVPGGPPKIPPAYIPVGDRIDVPQARIDQNIGSLEQRLQAAGFGLDVAGAAIDVVNAILATTKISTSVDVPTGTLFDGSRTTTTPSLPTTSYLACVRYASRLNSCASATSSFYSLPASAQASCACYTKVSTTDYVSCGVSSHQAVEPTALAISNFDSPANTCHEYIEALGYSNAAKALSGRMGNLTVLGAGFCANVDEDVKRSRNGSQGLDPTKPITMMGPCEAISPSPSRGSSTSRAAMLNTFDHAVLLTVPAIIASMAFLVFK
ncbi:hypothetical protein B0J11DRAFT_602367 [Dendryphion nanum]|uniref:Uncharacterized protein n=1 Tax=Dendryphion nanum TaxID=256645 RepID=A0A9P9IT84_9PLEO|nr:hypothetical protein B0J11DRAFT_602367 [Dendryphion nanum]